MSWENEVGEITSIIGLKDFELHDVNDLDFTPVFIDDTEGLTSGDQLSQEITLNMELSDGLTVMVDGF
tara:strand:+ start:110 stop:313 length:204 start_codon:yes stop_codon:yes gene_type:complete